MIVAVPMPSPTDFNKLKVEEKAPSMPNETAFLLVLKFTLVVYSARYILLLI